MTMWTQFEQSSEEYVLLNPNEGEVTLDRSIRVHSRPILTRLLPYSKQASKHFEDIYPKSSNYWYSRMIAGKSHAKYIVHTIDNDQRLWLAITNPVTNSPYEQHFIQPYEYWMLKLDSIEDYQRRWLESVQPENADEIAFSIMKSLEDEMSWKELAEVAQTIPPSFSRDKYAWNTLEQIIPEGFVGEARHELMAFLKWSRISNQLREDPIQFFFRLTSLPFFKSLLEVHYRFRDGDHPRYLDLSLSKAKKKQERYVSKTDRHQAFSDFLHKMIDSSPDLRHLALEYVRSMNNSGVVVTTLPVTKSQAARSRTSWWDRFSLFTLDLHIRTHVRVPAFGLRRAIYFGNAYRWPHPHLSWSSRLESDSEYPLHVQELILPPQAIEQVKHYLPNLLEIEWSARSTNPSRFASKLGQWKVSDKRILESVQRTMTERKIRGRFGRWKGKIPHHPTETEARILDGTNTGLDLAYLEHPGGRDYWGVSEYQTANFLTKMRDSGRLQVLYELSETKLPPPILIRAKGSKGQIVSLVSSFLRNSPSAVAYAVKNWEEAIIISSLPKSSRGLVSNLPIAGKESCMDIKCYQLKSFRNYTSDLFQRLLMPDGTWLADTLGLLSQGQSFPRTAMEG